ncbi:MAG: hypothetical protein J6R67_03255 [Treponema sp.]|nr:hypothetical protein [Treponema sp.]
MFFISKIRHNREIDTLNQAHAVELQKTREDHLERWSDEYHKRTNEEFAHNNTKTRLMMTENFCATMRSEALNAKRENAILRQILEDLTGKPVDELIEKHKRATRILEYGVELPDLPKQPAEDEKVEE